MKYEIYVPGFSRPGWTYKTFRGLEKKLMALAELNTLRTCTVAYGNEVFNVHFEHGKGGYGWFTRTGFGIPTDMGSWRSAHSRGMDKGI